MRLLAFFTSLFIGVNFAQAETYKCSAVWGLVSYVNDGHFILSIDQIPDLLLKTQEKVAMVLIGNDEPELYSLAESNSVTSVYQQFKRSMLHTMFVKTGMSTNTEIYYNYLDFAGSRYSYNYECSVN